MSTEPRGAVAPPDQGHSAWTSPPPPPRMRQLDFLLGSVRCVGKPRPDGSPGIEMPMRTRPILGGHYYESEGTWPGALISRIFGWNPVDEVFTEYYFSDSGMHGTMTSPGWQDGKLVMTGSLAMAGRGVMEIRDVFTAIDEDHFTIDSSRRSGAEWAPVERFACDRYERLELD